MSSDSLRPQSAAERVAAAIAEHKQVKPSLPARAVSFVRAVAGRRADAGVAEQRLAICMACPFLDEKRCGLCGCPVIGKTKHADATCPAQPPRWR